MPIPAEGAAPRNVGILIFDDVEVLDFCGPFEVLSSAAAPGEEPAHNRRLFNVITIAEELATVRCRGGLLVQPHATINTHPTLDILLVPGGFGTRPLLDNRRVLDWIVRQSETVELTTSVCTGSLLLAAAGLLDGKRATTHWGAIDELVLANPNVIVVDDQRFVEEGNIVTSAGVSAGIDMALALVERLHGLAIAETTARDMEYVWNR
jgi:transcriptional regulator GlxA family with amidase domain